MTDDLTGEYIGLFRIVPSYTEKDESTAQIKYECEHVLSTLLDDVLFLYHDKLDASTADVIAYILEQQSVKHWRVGNVQITRYFSYKWENANLLEALFSITEPFDVPALWTFDTTTYPWTLNLVQPDELPTCEIREGKNLVGFQIERNPMSLYNRIYPLGYGEGVNQLTIKDVNNGVPYVEDAESIAQYGVRATTWVDRRFENANALKASAIALLNEWKTPRVSWQVGAADISAITGEDIDRFKLGRVVRIVTDEYGAVDMRIVTESKPNMSGAPGDIRLEIGNVKAKLDTTLADLDRRQRINELYAQGATSMLLIPHNDNADQSNPAVMRFYYPEEFVRINKCLLSYKTEEFRAYSRATKGGGATTQTTSSGGGTAKSTASGGGSTQTSSAGGGTTVSSSNVDFAGANLRTDIPYGSITPPYETHEHLVPLLPGQLAHSHSVTVPNHTHSISIPSHTHDFDIPNHTHSVTIPNHTHDIEYGIYKLTTKPTSVTIKVDGNAVPGNKLEADNIDLIPYLSKDAKGNVLRGWHTVEITPNNLGRINAQVSTQYFIQSRGGVNL